jgi:hypothetical protein
MNLEDLKQSISTMSDEELLNTIKQIRQSRRTPKGEAATTKRTAPAAKTMPDVSSLDKGTKDLLLTLLQSKYGGTKDGTAGS